LEKTTQNPSPSPSPSQAASSFCHVLGSRLVNLLPVCLVTMVLTCTHWHVRNATSAWRCDKATGNRIRISSRWILHSRCGSAKALDHGTLARRGEMKHSLISAVICHLSASVGFLRLPCGISVGISDGQNLWKERYSTRTCGGVRSCRFPLAPPHTLIDEPTEYSAPCY
jgi:hypothetical protein